MLLVETDPLLRDVLQDFLADEGFEVSVASDLYGALCALAQEPTDLILTDALSAYWGEDALAPVRQMVEAAPGTPVILLTAHLQAAKLDPASAGLAAVVVKPFDLEELLACVHASRNGSIPLRSDGLDGRSAVQLEQAPTWRPSSERDPDAQRHEQIAKWKPVVQAELRELLGLIDAGFVGDQREDRARYDVTVDRFIGAVRELRAAMKLTEIRRLDA